MSANFMKNAKGGESFKMANKRRTPMLQKYTLFIYYITSKNTCNYFPPSSYTSAFSQMKIKSAGNFFWFFVANLCNVYRVLLFKLKIIAITSKKHSYQQS